MSRIHAVLFKKCRKIGHYELSRTWVDGILFPRVSLKTQYLCGKDALGRASARAKGIFLPYDMDRIKLSILFFFEFL